MYCNSWVILASGIRVPLTLCHAFWKCASIVDIWIGTIFDATLSVRFFYVQLWHKSGPFGVRPPLLALGQFRHSAVSNMPRRTFNKNRTVLKVSWQPVTTAVWDTLRQQLAQMSLQRVLCILLLTGKCEQRRAPEWGPVWKTQPVKKGRLLTSAEIRWRKAQHSHSNLKLTVNTPQKNNKPPPRREFTFYVHR